MYWLLASSQSDTGLLFGHCFRLFQRRSDGVSPRRRRKLLDTGVWKLTMLRTQRFVQNIYFYLQRNPRFTSTVCFYSLFRKTMYWWPWQLSSTAAWMWSWQRSVPFYLLSSKNSAPPIFTLKFWRFLHLHAPRYLSSFVDGFQIVSRDMASSSSQSLHFLPSATSYLLWVGRSACLSAPPFWLGLASILQWFSPSPRWTVISSDTARQ